MQSFNLQVSSPSLHHMNQQHKNKTLFRKNISSRLFSLPFFSICTCSLFSFGWWYTLMKNKHQISLYLGLKKMAKILQITFSTGFSFKKITVCLSDCLCLSHLFHYVPIMVSSGVITNDISDVYAKVQGQRSRIKVTEVKNQSSHFGTIIPVWFHIWYEMMHKAWYSLGAVPYCQISRSHG